MSDLSLSLDSLPAQVCLVEDDDHIRNMIVEILEDTGICVDVCQLGWLAHRCIHNTAPKAIILDVNMPNVDGIQLFSVLRGNAKTASIPVIFLTANPMKVVDQVPNYEAMNAVLLPKPFRLEDLLDVVQAAVAP